MPDDLDLTLLADEVASRLIDHTSGPRVSFTQLARDWAPGEIHEQGTVVQHQGGIWQSRIRTASRPSAETGEWLLLTNGIRIVRSYQEREDPRVFGLLIGLTGGKTIDLPFRLALPVHRGQYRPGAHYFEGDEVEYGGATFRALVEAPGAPDGEGWIVVAARGRQGITGERGPKGEVGDQGNRGERGAQGDRGERGEAGAPGANGLGIIAVEQAEEPGFVRVVLEDGSISDPIDVATMRFVGLYRPGADYNRGEIVRLGFALWICVESTGDVPTATSSKWSLFLVSPEVGIGGDGSGSPPPAIDPNDFVRKAGDTMTGPLTVPLGLPNAMALAFGDATVGFYRAVGNLLEVNFAGSSVMQWGGALIRSAVPLDMSARQINTLADPILPQDAVNLRTLEAAIGAIPPPLGDFLPPIGGVLSGELFFNDPGGPDVPNHPGITFSARGPRIYWSAGGFILRRGGAAGEDIFIENNDGTNRQPIATRDYVDTADALRLPLAGGTMQGQLISAAGIPAQPGLAIGGADIGFYRAGNVALMNVAGIDAMAWGANAIGVYLTLGMTNNVIRDLADPLLPQDAVNLRTLEAAIGAIPPPLTEAEADLRYVNLTGDVMTGPLTVPVGNAVAPGLAFGDPTVGFYRAAGNTLEASFAGSSAMQWSGALIRSAVPIDMGNLPIANLLDPVQPADAANKRYVDTLPRSRSFVYMPTETSVGVPTPAIFLDVNVPMPNGLRDVLVEIEPIFASNAANGTTWSLLYRSSLNVFECPVIAYKFTLDPTGFFRASATLAGQITVAGGTFRLVLTAHTREPAPLALTQVGAGGGTEPTMRTLVTFTDLGPP